MENNEKYQKYLGKVKDSGWNLEYVPKLMRTYEICEVAVKQIGYVLRYVPKELRTIELCEIAVSQAGRLLSYVPEELRTFEMCEVAVKEYQEWDLDGIVDDIFDYVPRKFQEELAEKYNVKLPENVQNR